MIIYINNGTDRFVLHLDILYKSLFLHIFLVYDLPYYVLDLLNQNILLYNQDLNIR